MHERKEPALPVPKERFALEADIGPLIEKMTSGTYVPETPSADIEKLMAEAGPDYLFGRDPKDPVFHKRILDLWNGLKPERNALIAIAISGAWNDGRFAEERERLLKAAVPFETKMMAVTDAFSQAVTRWLKGARGDERLKPLAGRLDLIAAFMARTLRPDSTDFMIIRGADTANNVAVNLVTEIRRLEKKLGAPLTAGQFSRAVSRAFRSFGIPFASLNVGFGPSLIEQLFKTPSAFSLDKDGEEYVLKADRTAMSQLVAWDKKPVMDRTNSGETTRCPAMYQVEGHPAVIPEYLKWAEEALKGASDFR